MTNFWNMVVSDPAEWANVAVTAASTAVGVFIALMVRGLAHSQEKIATTQNIYGQWLKKKELSIEYPAITRLDSILYSGGENVSVGDQQVRIWFVLIIDILFNSYVAQKSGLYPKEVYREDMRAHIGRMIRYDSDLVIELMTERGYSGEGIVGEFHEEVLSLRDEILSEVKAELNLEREGGGPLKQGRPADDETLAFLLLDVFTDQAFGGNPLAVFPNAKGLSGALMQKLANELNLSETAFICGELENGCHELRIFTPRTELPFAGHPTLGAATALQLSGCIENAVRFRLAAGAVNVNLIDDQWVLTVPRDPETIATDLDAASAAEILGVGAHDILEVSGCDAGLPFNFVQLRTGNDVASVIFSHAAWKDHLSESHVKDVYVFAVTNDVGRIDVSARMFAPADGIAEDPATGSAAAALGGYLRARGVLGKVLVSQGEALSRASRLTVLVTPQEIQVAGSARLMGRGAFELSLLAQKGP